MDVITYHLAYMVCPRCRTGLEFGATTSKKAKDDVRSGLFEHLCLEHDFAPFIAATMMMTERITTDQVIEKAA